MKVAVILTGNLKPWAQKRAHPRLNAVMLTDNSKQYLILFRL
jgi:hypothetical protein